MFNLISVELGPAAPSTIDLADFTVTGHFANGATIATTFFQLPQNQAIFEDVNFDGLLSAVFNVSTNLPLTEEDTNGGMDNLVVTSAPEPASLLLGFGGLLLVAVHRLFRRLAGRRSLA